MSENLFLGQAFDSAIKISAGMPTSYLSVSIKVQALLPASCYTPYHKAEKILSRRIPVYLCRESRGNLGHLGLDWHRMTIEGIWGKNQQMGVFYLSFYPFKRTFKKIFFKSLTVINIFIVFIIIARYLILHYIISYFLLQDFKFSTHEHVSLCICVIRVLDNLNVHWHI